MKRNLSKLVAMMLSVAMVLTSFNVSAFAETLEVPAENTEVIETELAEGEESISESLAEEESDDASKMEEIVAEENEKSEESEAIAADEESEEEEEVAEEEATDTEEVSALSAEDDNIKVTPEAYYANVECNVKKVEWSEGWYGILYKPADDGVDFVTEAELESIPYSGGYRYQTVSFDEEKGIYTGTTGTTSYYALVPNKTYEYRIFYDDYTDETGMPIKFVSDVATFTTKPAMSAEDISFTNIKVTKGNYYATLEFDVESEVGSYISYVGYGENSNEQFSVSNTSDTHFVLYGIPLGNEEKEIIPAVKMRTGVDVDKWVYGIDQKQKVSTEATTAVANDIIEVNTGKVGCCGCSFDLELKNLGKADLDAIKNSKTRYLEILLFYKKTSDSYYTNQQIYFSSGAEENENSLIKTVEMGYLTAGTEYEYYVRVKKLGELTEFQTEKKNFTTLEDKVLTEEDIPDENLYKAIVKALYGRPLTASNLEDLTSVYMDSSNRVSNLKGLEYFNKLQSLYIYADYSKELVGLENLKEIEKLSSVQIYGGLNIDLNALSEIKNLSGITISGTEDGFASVKADTVFNHPKCSTVSFSYTTGLTSASFGEIPNLTYLGLTNAKVDSFEFLGTTEKLSSLTVQECGLTDLSLLENIKKPEEIQSFELSKNNISDVSGIEKLTKVSYINLYENNISDVSAFSGLEEINDLYLNYNKIKDVSALAGLKSLETLDLSNNLIQAIPDLSGLHLEGAYNFYLDNNYLTAETLKAEYLPSGLDEGWLSRTLSEQHQLIETSKVAINEFSLEGYGCAHANFMFKYVNPNNEDQVKVYLVDGDKNKIGYDETIYGTDSNETRTGYTAINLEPEKSYKVALCLEVVEGFGEVKKIYTDYVEFTAKAENMNATVSVFSAGEKARASVVLEPFYDVDNGAYDFKIDIYEHGTEKLVSSKHATINYGKAYNELTGLTVPAEYDYVAVISKNGKTVKDEIKGSFTTKEKVMYTEEDIPDATLRKAILNRVSELSDEAFFDVTDIRYTVNSYETEKIKDLKGIEKLVNLSSLDIEGNDVTDLSPILGLSNLRQLTVTNNMLTKIPNLSSMKQLSSIYLNFNMLTEDTLKKEYLPEAAYLGDPTFLSSALENQRTELVMKTAPKYFDTNLDSDGNTLYPVIVQFIGFRYRQSAKMTVTIDGKDYTMDSSKTLPTDSREGDIFVVTNIPVDTTASAKKTITVSVKTNAGTTVLENKTFEASFEKGNVTTASQVLKRTDTSVYLNVDISKAEYEQLGNKVKSVELVKDGKSYLSTSSSNVNSTDWDNRYMEYFGRSVRTGFVSYTVYAQNMKGLKFLPEGKFDAVITGINDTTITVKDAAICVGDSEKLYAGVESYNSYLDSTGEYAYVKMKGQNINADTVHPEFKDSEGIKALDFVAQVYNTTERAYILKYKKVGTKWTENSSLSLDYTINVPTGIMSVASESGTIVVENAYEISLIHYNYKKGHTEYYLPSSYEVGKKLKVELYDRSDNERKNLVASAEGAVDANHMLTLDFKAGGKDYIPAYADRNVNRNIVLIDGDKEMTNVMAIKWYNYSIQTGSSSDGYSYTELYPIRTTDKFIQLKLGYSNLKSKTVKATIEGNAGASIVNDIKLDASGKSTSKIDLGDGLSEGSHKIFIVDADNQTIFESYITVYDNNFFYTQEQYGWIDDDGAYAEIQIQSDQIYGESNRKNAGYDEKDSLISSLKDSSKYTINLYDANKEVIKENVKISSVSGSDSYIYIVMPLTKDELEYAGMYVKASFKIGDTYKLGVRQGNTSTTYYSNLRSSEGDENVGKWITHTTKGRGYLRTHSYDGYHGVYGGYVYDDALFPITVYAYRHGTGEEVAKFTIAQSATKGSSGYREFSFTKAMVEKYMKDVFDVVLVGSDGFYMDKEIGYLVYDGANEKYEKVDDGSNNPGNDPSTPSIDPVPAPETQKGEMPVENPVNEEYEAGEKTISAELTGTCIFNGGKQLPAVAVTAEDGTPLVLKKDYTVAYKNNKNANMVYTGVKDGVFQFEKNTAILDKKQPMVVITFKGDYKALGKKTIYFNIYPRNINEDNYAGTILSSAKKGVITAKTGKAFKFLKKATVNLPNTKGEFKAKGLNAKKDINPNATYMVVCDENGNIKGDAYDAKTNVSAPADTYYTISITGIGNYFGTRTGDVFKLARK